MMTEHDRHPRAVVLNAGGKPCVPEPHKADYSAEIPDTAFDLIDELCPQDKVTEGTLIATFVW